MYKINEVREQCYVIINDISIDGSVFVDILLFACQLIVRDESRVNRNCTKPIYIISYKKASTTIFYITKLRKESATKKIINHYHYYAI